ncbi:melatonin receptor type 1A-like [Gigantopelta aegis]|uniref:melatonin receptor type 1A-like n=1 Tax=Gigantopelta aegis TaxID=1735272 RepID=UPI001B88C11E|nr:melatonin receptor type 1A-like [Gigantopelta aegis]
MSNNSLAVPSKGNPNSAKQTADVVLKVFEIAIVPVIVCGNILIISAVCRFKNLRSASNVMIASLAVGDLMMGGIYMPTKLAIMFNTHIYAERIPCLTNIFLSYFSVITAMFFLSMLSIERFYAVQFPFHYHSAMTLNRSVVLSVVVFSLSFTITLPIIFGIDLWAPGKFCFNTNILPGYYVWSMVSVVFVVQFAGFLCFLRVLAAEISIRMRNVNVEQSESRRQDSVKSTLILTVYVFSILCWIPQLVYLFISVFSPRSTNLFGLRAVSLLGVCSSAVNCFVYGIKNSKFRNAFRKMFGCRPGRVDPSTELNTQEEVF